jgi:hypothetical protein
VGVGGRETLFNNKNGAFLTFLSVYTQLLSVVYMYSVDSLKISQAGTNLFLQPLHTLPTFTKNYTKFLNLMAKVTKYKLIKFLIHLMIFI